jgi:hypothetical protein
MNNLQKVFEEGRLTRFRWSDKDSDGRQLLCLYTALAGSPNARPDTCPADLAPRWLAYILPWMDDSPSNGAWPEIVRRLVALSPKFSSFGKEQHLQAIRVVLETTRWLDTSGSCDDALSLVDRELTGKDVDKEWSKVFSKAKVAVIEAEAELKNPLSEETRNKVFQALTGARAAMELALGAVATGRLTKDRALARAVENLTDSVSDEICFAMLDAWEAGE